jgi:hypothetical protein
MKTTEAAGDTEGFFILGKICSIRGQTGRSPVFSITRHQKRKWKTFCLSPCFAEIVIPREPRGHEGMVGTFSKKSL